MRVNEIKKDLRSLSILLKKWSKVKNADILAQVSVKEINGVYEYIIEPSKPLIFRNIDFENHSIPSGIEKLKESENDIEIQLCIKFSEFKVNENQFVDSIKEMGVSIKISGDYFFGEEIKHTVCSWHIDKHNGPDCQTNHPIYHLNFGGNNMNHHTKNDRNYFGNLLLLPTPRILHPPLDLVLSCDFIIKNFYMKENHEKITSLPEYQNLIKNSMNRYWKPFFYGISSKWDNSLKPLNLTFEQIIDYK